MIASFQDSYILVNFPGIKPDIIPGHASPQG